MDYIQYLRGMVGHERVIMVVAGVLIFDEENRILLHLRTDSTTWGLPGGFMNMDESVSDAAKREVKEEIGLDLGELTLYTVRSGPHMHRTLPSGDKVALVQILYTCSDFSGDWELDQHESLDAAFFPLDELPENMFSDHRDILKEFL